MKRIRVTVTEEYLIPDDWEITTHPHDKISCLRGDNEYYLPDLAWAEYDVHVATGQNETGPRGSWTNVNEDREGWFIDRLQTSDAKFEVVE